MSKGVRIVALAMLMSLSVAGCASSQAQIREQALQDYIEREQVLQDYIEHEREAVSAMMTAQPDIYSTARVTGQVGADPADPSVITFTYTYARLVEFGNEAVESPSWVLPRPSWADPLVSWDQLESSKAQLASSCDTVLFPSMREAGLEGPLRVEYVYLQPNEVVSWDVTCASFG